ncbi:MAG: aminomethyl-transferring glycine dehydrogenase subunit GcvPB [Desulforegulaceae bacterium]|nr:aminomethyl-transferring glycine dehydrogenase subunit GcvPB [Desulforegulaceae bacterium]
MINDKLTGLVLDEPLLWEKGSKGRIGISIPESEVEKAKPDTSLLWEGPDFPELSEVDVVRHFTRLSTWNFGVDTGMYPLGSCTMKYNPKLNEKTASMEGFISSHPLLPENMCQGSLKLMHELQELLCEITGLDAFTLQPAAGAQGELCGMLVFNAFHKKNGKRRKKIIIPDTAHGTNPASCALCGFEPVGLNSGSDGILHPDSVREIMDEDTAGIMITNPNTLGLFEENIKEIAEIVHEKGGLVYCDGANMNAIMGAVSMREIGVDVIHLNLHKTFSTPHGGGGPGAGPVGVVKRLEEFLPVPRVEKNGDKFVLNSDFPLSIGKLHAFHGNYGVLIKAYTYILSMGKELFDVSTKAVLNANYIKENLKDVFHLPYDRPCMHECVFTDENFEEYKVSTLDIAKRLLDFGFHPPTIYFPLVVHGAIMIEPTESESKEEIDKFIEVMKQIAKEAKENPDILHNAPANAKVKRLDETLAARKPKLKG